MAKNEGIQMTGTVIESLSNSNFRVKIEIANDSNQEHTIICNISGKMRKNYIKIIPGDSVEVIMSPYDLTKGRIIKRNQTNSSINSINRGGRRKK